MPIVNLTDDSGKTISINTDHIVKVEYEKGDPDEPAVEAQDAVDDDPGEEPSYAVPLGRPPKKGHPKIEAKAAKAGTPDKATVKMLGGDSVKVQGTARGIREALGIN